MITAKFNHPENGTTFDIKYAADFLTEGNEYNVDYIMMGGSNTSIFLSDFPEKAFNSVQFDFYEDGEKLDIYRDSRYNPYI